MCNTPIFSIVGPAVPAEIVLGFKAVHMARATIIVSADCHDEVEAVDRWFARWRERLSHVSENQGGGCCVDIYDVEGPPEAIEELPAPTRAISEWSMVDGRYSRPYE